MTIAKRVLLGLVLIYIIVLIALNTEEVRVNFVLFEARTSLVAALVLAAGLCAVFGWGFAKMRRSSK